MGNEILECKYIRHLIRQKIVIKGNCLLSKPGITRLDGWKYGSDGGWAERTFFYVIHQILLDDSGRFFYLEDAFELADIHAISAVLRDFYILPAYGYRAFKKSHSKIRVGFI